MWWSMWGVVLVHGVLGTSTGAQQALGPCVAKTDKNVYPEPDLPTLPPAGGVVTDPTFCTPILRVTDEADGHYFQTASSYWPTFNRAGTRIYFLRDEGGLSGVTCRFDPDRFRVSDKQTLFTSPTPDGDIPSREDAIWSGSDPDVLFTHSKLNLWSYNVATGEYTLLRDFIPELGEGHLRQMSRSLDDNTFAFTTLNRRYRATGSMVWRRDEDRVILRPLEPEGLDEVQVDKLGRYLVIKTGGSGQDVIQVRVLDIDTGVVEELTDGAPDYAPGHGDAGRGVYVGYDNWLNRLRLRKLSSPHGKRTVLDRGNDWSQDVHVSMLADDEDWMLLSFYNTNCGPAGLYHNEIVMMRTDGSEEVRRLAHHRSCVEEYWDSPRGNVSRDGRFAAFTSNWGGADRRDVFILDARGSRPARDVKPLP